MPEKKLKVHIVSHTHWDREWYLPFHCFRQKLHSVIKEVLDLLESSAGFNHFVLDGQSILVEDHLEVHPEDSERIRKLVKSGKLAIGPWYILPDEFLVSGEATVRNLLIGRRVGSQFGPIQKIGYMPDSFGHIAQMPQILRKAGIDNFIYTRGNGDELERTGLEFLWQAPDGRNVLAIKQFQGYCNAGALGFEGDRDAGTQRYVSLPVAKKQIRTLLNTMPKYSNTHILLFNNGCDHLPPQREFEAVLKYIKKSFPDTKFLHSDFSTYLDEIRKHNAAKETFRGEMLSGKYHYILSGVWSARIYLKQSNDRAQTILEKYLEPFASYTHFCFDIPYPKKELNYLWKTLLKNHPHDSICGCSVDTVHREMIPRFDAVLQTSDQLMRHMLEILTLRVSQRKKKERNLVVSVFNPLPRKRSEVIECYIILPDGLDPRRMKLQDHKGKDVPVHIIEQFFVDEIQGVDFQQFLFGSDQQEFFAIYKKHFKEYFKKMKSPEQKYKSVIHLQMFVEDIPALGHKNLYLTPGRYTKLKGGNKLSASENTIENLYYIIRIYRNGQFDVFIKASRTWLRGMNRFEDTEDIGDEYDYAPCRNSRSFYTDKCAGNINITTTEFRAIAEIDLRWTLPNRITDTRKSRSADKKECRLITRIGLTKQSPVIGIETEFENNIKDHRLRVHFPSSIKTNRIFSDGQFIINERPIRQSYGTGWVQKPAGTYPQQAFSYVCNDDGGLAVFNKGLAEIQAIQNKTAGVNLALTLLRCVEWLSRSDLSTRPGNAGPVLYTPDAQCQGIHHFHYAVLPVITNEMCSMIPHLSDMYHTPVIFRQGVRDNHKSGEISFLRQRTYRSRISAVKLHERRNTLIVRLYNTTPDTMTEVLLTACDVQKVWITDLHEIRRSKLKTFEKNRITVSLKPHEIVTIEVKFKA